MATTAQARAVKNYRKRLNKRGMARFEVTALDADRELIRTFARRLAENDPEAGEIRALVRDKVTPKAPKKGGVYEALRRWPISDLNLERPFVEPRKIDL